ncbi:hypothetical protein BUALT_Bualt05G0020700 [Buddleja alternifolia]|uniref:ENT domain-containing protein n=1 Tax=Buddleja alternifolia TaxID=168488 RepID=A0AAV6XHR6_9LAMI|nr:hypothetical protein BUALT_Bualt05G0020700 [Buddleja alternifolia]
MLIYPDLLVYATRFTANNPSITGGVSNNPSNDELAISTYTKCCNCTETFCLNRYAWSSCWNITFSEVVNLIWQARNEMVHGEEVTSSEITMETIHSRVDEAQKAQEHNLDELEHMVQVRWEKLDRDKAKLSDAKSRFLHLQLPDILPFVWLGSEAVPTIIAIFVLSFDICRTRLATMRFKKGDEVEAMDKEKVPVSWRTAKILSGNGRSYCVQYDSPPAIGGAQMVEMVLRKFVRPCPPPVQGVDSCVSGDIVEVFYECSWKIAAILENLGGKKENVSNKIHPPTATFQNQYLVRLLGRSEELIVDRSNIRMRQAWQDGKWFLMGKSFGAGNDVIVSKSSTSNFCQKINFQGPQFNARNKNQLKRDCMNIQDAAAFLESPVISSRSLKRMSPYSSSIVEAHNGHVQKFRAIEKEGRNHRLVATTPVLEKVDAVAYPRNMLGEKNMHASVKIISNGYNQMKSTKQNDVYHYSGVRSSELNTSDSDACSVGSCSINNQSSENYYNHFIPLPSQEKDTLCSDAESSCGRKKCTLPPKEEVEVSIRKLELSAYRRTLEALYASGPLSWEQETLLTNLRIMLHISNDEHLKELKHLISTKTAISVR